MDIADVAWEGSFEGWSRKYISKNMWRVEPLMDYSDAVQECALLFLTIRKHYRGKVDNAGWLMSLFKTTVRNHWNTISMKASAKKVLEVSTEDLAGVREAIVSDSNLALSIFRRPTKKPDQEVTMAASKNMYQEFVEKLKLEAGATPEQIIRATSEVSQDDWNTLSEPAQKWYNDSVNLVMAQKAPLELPGYTPAKAPKAAAAKSKKVAGEKAGQVAPKYNEVNTLCDLIVANPDASDDILSQKMANMGLKLAPSTISFYVKTHLRLEEAKKRAAAKVAEPVAEAASA
jgi:NACalpha-BTF3-like transcription factor